MTDQDKGPPSQIRLEGVGRDAYFIVTKGEPEIAEAHARECPQCGKQTWALSRWCWHCYYDFAPVKSPLPALKLLALLVAANAVIALIALLRQAT